MLCRAATFQTSRERLSLLASLYKSGKNNTTLFIPEKAVNTHNRGGPAPPLARGHCGTLGVSISAAVALFWLGMLVGVSFLATPVKFAAPSLSLPTALEVGRVTFALFSKVEWALYALLVGATFMTARWSIGVREGALACLLLILAIQTFWLLPTLDAQVGRIMAGDTIPSTGHHHLYIALEVAKGLLLGVVAFEALRLLGCRRSLLPCA